MNLLLYNIKTTITTTTPARNTPIDRYKEREERRKRN
jgi:hypothetical protein